MDKNFRVRAIVSIVMIIVAAISICVLDGIPFRVIYTLFSLVALIELLSFFVRSKKPINFALALLEIIFLCGGAIFLWQIDISKFWYVFLGVPGYDISAYLFGKIFGGKMFPKSRPFPHISKNKTWEGTILGLITSVCLVGILMAGRDAFAPDWPFLFCGVFAIIGDLFESSLKRTFKVKDSNEIVIKNPFFQKLELLVGGSEGHGGFLDRIDSTAFTMSLLLLLFIL